MLCLGMPLFFGRVPTAGAAGTTGPSTEPASVLTSQPVIEKTNSEGGADLTDLSLEQLMQVQVTTGTLTATERQLAPAAVTTIDSTDIAQQNPRSLNDLLNLYVPNLEISDHEYELPSVGIRGIIGDSNTKYLLLVDGREMNERTHFGSLSEQDLYLLGDIDHIDVVRGPGSATYGPGAVEGVIAIQTFNGLTYQGTEVDARGGIWDDFADLEIKHGQRLGPDSGWFIYGGAAQVTGADVAHAPIVEANNFVAADGPASNPDMGGTPIIAGKPAIVDYQREGAEYDREPQIKAHVEYDNGGVSIWTRYTRGGEELNPTDRSWGSNPAVPPDTAAGYGGSLPPLLNAVGYQQLTSFVGDKIELNDKLELDLSTSYDATDYERLINSAIKDSMQEDKLISKALLNWQMFPTNQLAMGSEYGYFWLGRPTWFDPSSDGLDSVLNGVAEPPIYGGISAPTQWDSNMLSFFAEDQWHINKQFTFFASARADKSRFTDWLYSPRGALAWQPEDKDTLKFIASQSLRTNTEEYMYLHYLTSDTHSAPESMNSLEIRYERQQTDRLLFASSVFYNRLGSISYDKVTAQQDLIGAYKTAGIEVEANYRTEDDNFTASNGFTKLVGQTFNEPLTQAQTLTSSAPYGFGYDLNDWSNDVTKISEHHDFNQHFSVDGNIQVMWGYKGSQDYLNFANSITGPTAPSTSSVPGYKQPFGTTAYLNLGAEYKFDDHQSVRFDAYNVLGLFDYRLNKDDVIGPNFYGNYRVQSPAFGLTYRLSF